MRVVMIIIPMEDNTGIQDPLKEKGIQVKAEGHPNEEDILIGMEGLLEEEDTLREESILEEDPLMVEVPLMMEDPLMMDPLMEMEDSLMVEDPLTEMEDPLHLLVDKDQQALKDPLSQ